MKLLYSLAAQAQTTTAEEDGSQVKIQTVFCADCAKKCFLNHTHIIVSSHTQNSASVVVNSLSHALLAKSLARLSQDKLIGRFKISHMLCNRGPGMMKQPSDENNDLF